jgi:thymidine phosphorylase
MSAPRNNEDSVLDEMLTTMGGEEVNPQIFDIPMKLAKKMFLEMKEDEAKRKAEEEEARRKTEEE